MFFAPDPAMLCLLEPSPDDLVGLDRSIAELRQRDAGGGAALPHHVFQYAAALISHRQKELLEEGVHLMEGLVFQVWRRRETEAEAQCSGAAIVADGADPSLRGATNGKLQKNAAAVQESTPDMLPVYYYYIAIAWTKLEDLVKARSAVERMLMLEPHNGQGRHLREHIEKLQNRDGLIGLVGATAALGAAIACFSILRRK
jgi:hypothetical protein